MDSQIVVGYKMIPQGFCKIQLRFNLHLTDKKPIDSSN